MQKLSKERLSIDLCPSSDEGISNLVNDNRVALKLDTKPVTIRGQRHKRKHGLPHWFKVDAVYIGSSPRYFLHEVDAWIAQQSSCRMKNGWRTDQ